MRFRVRARVDTVDQEVVASLRRAGVHVVSIGMESGSQTMLDRMGKRISLEQAEMACRLTREAGLLVTTSWVIGFPGETPRTVAETLAFVRRIRPNTATFCRLEPLPGTRVYDQAKAAGLLDGDWSIHSHRPWIKLPWLSSEAELDRVVAEAQRQSYRHGIAGLLAIGTRSALGFDRQTWRAAGRLVWSMLSKR
jgi:anaerobic magnesium-protoporphyrin IX monomethyl ester cyclase